MVTNLEAIEYHELLCSDTLEQMTELLRVSSNPNVTIGYEARLRRIMDGPHDGGGVLGLRTIKHDNGKSRNNGSYLVVEVRLRKIQCKRNETEE